MNEHNSSKREFIKKAMYVAPAILTLKAIPSFASSGSGQGTTGTTTGTTTTPNLSSFLKFFFGR
jgi:hypothetical protein